MKLSIWRVNCDLVSVLVPFQYFNHLPINWTDANCFASIWIGKSCVACNSFPTTNFKNTATRVRYDQKEFPGRIESHRYQTSDNQIHGVLHGVLI